jgi:hypothetical protein
MSNLVVAAALVALSSGCRREPPAPSAPPGVNEVVLNVPDMF